MEHGGFLLVKTEPVKILLIEDDVIDQMAVQRAFKREQIKNEIIIAEDGVEALEILRGEHPTKSLEWPFLILLDLNMPRMGGLELLEHLRDDPRLCKTVVFVLSTSDDDGDVAAAYDANVAGYIVKSSIGESFRSLIGVLKPYWEVVQLPATNAKLP